jgi:2-polyprenyl-6-methoxyphenol hydroxylase-like FAD-dependent oxidoreductase
MDMVHIRTMEFCRRWGIVSDVENAPYQRDYPQDNVYLTSLNGYEIGRQPMPSMRQDVPPPESPQKRERCPQNMFDPVLQKFAKSQPTTKIQYEHELLSFKEEADGVCAIILDLKNKQEFEVKAKFLVGCDGGRSLVRETLGIPMNGRGILTNTTNVVFKCPEFNQLHDKQPGYRYIFVGPKGTWATIVAINGSDQWRMSIIGNAIERPHYSEEEIKQFAFKALGKEFNLEILSVLRWTRTELVADRYRRGRIFIAGDACHLTSPTGGLGMNTGIGDSVDLSWKLVGTLEGWGGPQLLDSYEIERRPIAKRITTFSTGNLEVMKKVPQGDCIEEDSAQGAQLRHDAGQALLDGLKREWFSQNMHLGNRYTQSPICFYEDPEDPVANEREFLEAIHYTQTARVGCRAPHVWLSDGRSTLDLFGKDFVFLLIGQDVSQELEKIKNELMDQPNKKGPIRVIELSDPNVEVVYQKKYVIVRPDGHIAWSSDQYPKDINKIINQITGW